MDDMVRSVLLLLVMLHMTNQVQLHSFFDSKIPLACDETPRKCSKVYQKINEDLVRAVRSEKVEKSMVQIADWIYMMDKKSMNTGLSDSEMSELTALHLIDDLKHIQGKGVCKISTATTLQKNDLALKGQLSNLGPDDVPKWRIGRILKYYSDKFFDDCDYTKRLEGFDEEKLEGLKRVIGELIGTCAQGQLDIYNLFGPRIKDTVAYVHDEPRAASGIAKGMKSLSDIKYTLIIYRYLIDEMAKDYHEFIQNGINDDWEFVSKPSEALLFNPCLIYTERLNALFANKWTIAQAEKRKRDSSGVAGLYKHLAYYYGCLQVLNKKSEIIQAILDLR